MALIKEIRTMENLTQIEQNIRDYIFQYPEKIAHMSARELGEATYTSAASVTRFGKRFGCKGYPDFKLRFLSELQAGRMAEEEEHEISERENIVAIVDKVQTVMRRAVDETKAHISMEQMVRIGDMIHEAEYIDFYAYDMNSFLASYGCNNLFYTGKVAHVYSETNAQELLALGKREKHLAILISHTGENSRLVQIAKTLQRNKTPMIIITCDKERRMAKIGGEVLYTAPERRVEQMETVMFAESVKYLLDIMFYMTFSRTYHTNLEMNQAYDKYGRSLWGVYNDYNILR